ncbi:protamine [Solea senegalensis]|uniref:Protamine n=1 Tax=Solea senegalensis TaxID=28829 RepID=A0AAV6QHK0_SOLSE|nr:histone H1-like [Solea senegalensis]KAG7490991.1 protamine [Solea senegalensis]
MSSAGIGSPSEAQAKSPRQRSRPTQKKTCPALSALILNAVAAERGSVSLPALKNALKAGGYDVTKNNARILTCIRRLVGNKCLLQTKGTGASGSFKKAPTPLKKVVKKKKAKKVKKASTKKETAGCTAVAKKSPKKKRRAESPKKVKKATAPKVKKAKSPKKPTAAKAKKAKKAKSPKKPKLVVQSRTRSAVRK